ncbi:MAG TPA: GNAT family protein [Erysipelothrix sp.]|nr:GNAT family protein [Erysipelothrix sp.]
MLEIKPIHKSDLKIIWESGYTQPFPKWAMYNAPYFGDYEKVDYRSFKQKYANFYLNSNTVHGIYVDEVIIGSVTYYYESKKTRWLEAGILIYSEEYWNKGYGLKAMRLWFDKLFNDINTIARIGITTWSGNPGMIKLAEKLRMKKEAEIRKVRYYEGVYYDSIKYGILREEWENIDWKDV